VDDVADLAAQGADVVGGVFAVIGLAIAAVLLVVLVLPLLFALVEVVALALLALVAIGARILFRRPWTVEAVASDETILEWRVVGWRASAEHARTVAGLLAAGMEPPGATRVRAGTGGGED
jgi:hypothetical protein